MWKKPPKSRLYVISACVIIVLVIALIYVARSLRDNYGKLDAAIARKEKKIAALSQIIRKADAIEQEYARIKSSQAAGAAVPQAQVLKNLQDAANNCGLVITRLKPEELSNIDNGRGSDLRIEARATMPALGQFLYHLPDINLPLTIKYLQLDTETRSEDLKIQLLLNTLSINDDRKSTGKKTD